MRFEYFSSIFKRHGQIVFGKMILMKLTSFAYFFSALLILTTRHPEAAVFGEPTNLEPNMSTRSDLVFYGGFEAEAPGSATWNKNWGIGFNNRIANATLVTGAEALAGSKAIRIDYPQGGVGPTQTGMQFPISFGKIAGMQATYDSLYLRYYVYFEPGFDFVQGGKLPGLMGGGNSWSRSGGDQPSGSNGWTMRFMWRANGAAVVYAYLPDSKYKAGIWGTDIDLGTSFQTGKWHCVEQFIQVNSIGNEDGKLQVWLDNVQVLNLNDVLYRTVDNDSGKVGGIYVSTFHGGNTVDWAPSVTSFARFDGFAAALHRVGPLDQNPNASRPRAHFSPSKGLNFIKAGNLLQIPGLDPSQEAQVQVVDLDGSTTHLHRITTGFDLSPLKPGVYMVILERRLKSLIRLPGTLTID